MPPRPGRPARDGRRPRDAARHRVAAALRRQRAGTEVTRLPKARSMPKLDGILETALYVDDLERSARFYHDIFGFEVIDGAGGRLWSLAVSQRQILLLCRKGASAKMERRAHDGDGRLHL